MPRIVRSRTAIFPVPYLYFSESTDKKINPTPTNCYVEIASFYVLHEWKHPHLTHNSSVTVLLQSNYILLLHHPQKPLSKLCAPPTLQYTTHRQAVSCTKNNLFSMSHASSTNRRPALFRQSKYILPPF